MFTLFTDISLKKCYLHYIHFVATSKHLYLIRSVISTVLKPNDEFHNKNCGITGSGHFHLECHYQKQIYKTKQIKEI